MANMFRITALCAGCRDHRSHIAVAGGADVLLHFPAAADALAILFSSAGAGSFLAHDPIAIHMSARVLVIADITVSTVSAGIGGITLGIA